MTTDSTSRLLNFEAGPAESGQALHQFATELYPIHRAITGSGVRATLNAIAQRIPLEVRHVPTGQAVLDWHVPPEWVIRDAFVEHPAGHKVIDLGESNLHVVSYSVAVDQQMNWQELTQFLHTVPEYPAWIPYRTAHFQTRWGFCLSHERWQKLNESPPTAPFRVRIDAEQKPGVLNWGEVYLPGQREDEFLISTHICHPSLANDNLSGIVVATELARRLAALPERPISFRFLFIPATIGAITWLAQHRSQLNRIKGGLVLSNLGDRGSFTYKTSRQQTALIDQTAASVLNRWTSTTHLRHFTPWGYDERQFCSPGFNLPIGRLTRTPEGEYPQYHTSADNLTFIHSDCLAESLRITGTIISEFARSIQLRSPQPLDPEITSEFDLKSLHRATADPQNKTAANCEPGLAVPHKLEHETGSGQDRYLNLRPYGEPKLDRYGLYQGYGTTEDLSLKQAVMWILNLSDGKHTFADIAVRSGLATSVLRAAIQRLSHSGLLKKID